MNRRSFLYPVFFLVLAACSSVPSAPVDRFYRLQPVRLSLPPEVLAGAIAVQPFSGDSLYAERPIIYVEASSPRRLRQYHYHLWLYSPARMVQEHLVGSLDKTLDLTGEHSAAYQLNGRVLSFERVISSTGSKAVVVLQLRLSTGSRMVINKTYQTEQSARDDSLEEFVMAMELALGNIHRQFIADLVLSKP